MNDDNEATVGVFSNENLLPVPVLLATLMVLFLGTDYVANGGMDNDGYIDILILPVIAAFAAFLGRVLDTSGESQIITKTRTSLVSIFLIVFSLLLIEFSILLPIEGFTFAFVSVSSLVLSLSNRNEESSILLSVIIGFYFAISSAARYTLDDTSWLVDGNPNELMDIVRSSIGSMFFASWAASISLGILLTLFMRGRFASPGSGSWFRDIPSVMPNVGIITAAVIFVVNLIPLIWLGTIQDLTSYENHHYLGSVWAMFATIVVLFVSFCNSERWHVLGTIVALNWVMYTIAHLQEIGNDLPLSTLNTDNNVGLFTWFLLVFWLNVGGIMIAARGKFGDISPRRDHSEFRKMVASTFTWYNGWFCAFHCLSS